MHPCHDFPRQPLDCHGRPISVGDRVEGFLEEVLIVEALMGDAIIYTRNGIQYWTFACCFKICPPLPDGRPAAVMAVAAPELPDAGEGTLPDSSDFTRLCSYFRGGRSHA